MTTQEYWKQVRAIAAKFDPAALAKDRTEEEPGDRVHLRRSESETWLTSIENREKGSVPGQTVQMKPYAAAERIFAQTHREATAEEISAEQARRADMRSQILAIEEAKKGTVNTTVNINPQQFAEAVVAASAASQKPARSRVTD